MDASKITMPILAVEYSQMNLANDFFATWVFLESNGMQFSSLNINSARFSSLNINYGERDHEVMDIYKCSEITLLSGLTGHVFYSLKP